MATYSEQWELANYPPFQRRVQMAALDLAQYIQETEPIDVKGHLEREALAKQVQSDPGQHSLKLALSVVTRPEITLTSTDAEIKQSVDYAFNTISGANKAEVAPVQEEPVK